MSETLTEQLTRANKVWSLRLVAKWCEDRAAQHEDRKLLKQLRSRYAIAAITPYERFTVALQNEVDEHTEFWMGMAKAMREEADELARTST